MLLKTNYRDDVFEGNRKYRKTDNPDGTISLEDVTAYKQVGDTFAATDINATNAAINAANDVREVWMRVNGFTPNHPYILRLDVPGMKATDRPEVSHIIIDGATDPNVIKGAWKSYSCIDRVDTFDGYIIVSCFRKRPAQDILLGIKGVGI